jgi:GT2 family glycosyltransferase
MNLGIQWALMHNADFVWVLNNDTTAPPDTAAKLIAAAADPKTGIVGTVLHYMHAPGNVQAWGGGRVWPSMGYVKHFDAPAPLVRDSFLTFASVLLRCRMLEEIGLMDERYFMYFEDADFCFRARQRGWKLAVAADTCVLHKVGGSSDAKNLRQDRIVTASGLRFLHRFGRPRTSAKALFVLSRLAKRLSTGQLARAGAVLQGVEDWIREKPMAFRRER